MTISLKTKLSKILKTNEQSIETIVSINRYLEKLKNPELRKIFFPKVTLEQVAKIGKVEPQIILTRLEKLGFKISC